MANGSSRLARAAPTVAFVLLGGYTILMQVILLRECFLLFSGNELSLAIQLGLWLCFTAAGGALGSLLGSRAAPVLLVALPLAGIWSLLAVRIVPPLLPQPTGWEIPVGLAVLTLLLAQIPLNLVAGATFPTACRFFAGDGEASAIGRFYRLEALGAAAAGAAFTFLFAGNVRGVELALWLSAFAAFGAAAAVWSYSRRVRFVGAALGCALVACGIFGDAARRLDDFWWAIGHPRSKRFASVETRYERIDIGFEQGLHTVYSNGVPAFALEDVEESSTAYQIADLYLALHLDPKRILILGSGEHGLCARVLGHPVERVVWVLLDPSILDAVKSAAPDAAFQWDDTRLRVVVGDGRRYLQGTSETFDLILLDLPAPTTAAGNRFFTAQAFREAKSRLRPNGLVVFRLPSSAHYMAGETEMLLASIHRALREAFGSVEIIPGESMIFVAPLMRGGVPSLDVLAARFASRNVPARLSSGRLVHEPAAKDFIFRALYEPEFNEFRREQQLAQLESAQAVANDDFRPIAYYLNLRRWLREMSAGSQRAARTLHAAENFVWFLKSHWLSLTLLAAALLAAIFFVLGSMRRSAARRSALAFAVLSSGWAGMLGELAIVFVYQSRFGQIYNAMGALFATYMAALVAGSSIARRWCAADNTRTRWLIATRGSMIASCAVALAAFHIESAAALFLALFAYALALGMEYPIANQIYRQDEGGTRAAGVLHSMDHLGAALATLTGGTVLLPLLGPLSALFSVACLHAIVLSILGTVFFLRR